MFNDVVGWLVLVTADGENESPPIEPLTSPPPLSPPPSPFNNALAFAIFESICASPEAYCAAPANPNVVPFNGFA